MICVEMSAFLLSRIMGLHGPLLLVLKAPEKKIRLTASSLSRIL